MGSSQLPSGLLLSGLLGCVGWASVRASLPFAVILPDCLPPREAGAKSHLLACLLAARYVPCVHPHMCTHHTTTTTDRMHIARITVRNGPR